MIEEPPRATLLEALGVTPGLTAVAGSGGKSSLVAALAGELAASGALDRAPAGGRDRTPGTAARGPREGRDGAPPSGCAPTVIVATSTHMRPAPGMPLYTSADERALARLLEAHGGVCCGTPAGAGKISAPALGFDELVRCAGHVLVEADGSRGLPLKAHAAHEPVVPRRTALAVIVVGAAGFGKPIAEAVHRPELFCALAGAAPQDAAEPEAVARVLAAEIGAGCFGPGRGCAVEGAPPRETAPADAATRRLAILVNQADTEGRRGQAERFLEALATHTPRLAGTARTVVASLGHGIIWSTGTL